MDPSTFCPLLQGAVVKGKMICDVVRANPNKHIRIANEVWLHDQENNEYLPSVVPTKIRLCLAVKQIVAGGDWNSVIDWLCERYGHKKSSTVRRWVTASKTLPEELVVYMEKRVADNGFNHGL